MCKISDKIKFCTCVDEDVEIEKLDNYWILYREDKSHNLDFIIQIGEFVLTENISSNFEFNKNTILKRLNEDIYEIIYAYDNCYEDSDFGYFCNK